MLFSRTNTYGVDSKIYLIQRYLNTKLPWFSSNGGNLTAQQIRIYGMVYQNSVGGQNRPENYISGKDYEFTLDSDKSVVQVAFHLTGDIESNFGQFTVPMDIIFTMNVDEIYNNNSFETQRALMEIDRVLQRCGYINEITGYKRGIRNVFADFDLPGIEHDDQAPRWCLSCSCVISFVNDKCKERVSDQELITADNIEITVDSNVITADQLYL